MINLIILFIAAHGDTFHREQDPEINRLFTSSPPAPAIANAATYYGDNSFYKTDIDVKSNNGEEDKKMKKINSGNQASSSSKIHSDMVRLYAKMDSKAKAAADKKLFEGAPVPTLPPRAIPAETTTETTATTSSSNDSNSGNYMPSPPLPPFQSLLTKSLTAPDSGRAGKGKGGGGGTAVTIYLPDRFVFLWVFV